MPRMGRPKTKIEYAEPDQYNCLLKIFDRDRDRWVLCGDPVPEGDLPSLAHNSASATFLALCKRHRQALAETIEEYRTAAIGQGAVKAARVELSEGRLVSHSRLREALVARNLAGKNGPLTDEQELTGVELLYGPEEAARLAERKLAT